MSNKPMSEWTDADYRQSIAAKIRKGQEVQAVPHAAIVRDWRGTEPPVFRARVKPPTAGQLKLDDARRARILADMVERGVLIERHYGQQEAYEVAS